VVPTARCPGPRFASADRLDPLAGHRDRGRSEPQDREGTGARSVVIRLLELGEAQIDEPDDLGVDPGLVFDQVHRNARRLAQLRTGQGLTGPRLIGHPQGCEGTRVGGIARDPLEPARPEGLCRDRVDHRDRDGLAMERCGERQPLVAAGLHHHPVDRTVLCEPTLELRESGPIGAEAEDRLVRRALALPTDCCDVLAFADVDADAVHQLPSPPFLPSGSSPAPAHVC